MAADYERELERVRKARAEFEASQDEVERRKQDYFTAVRTLHETGMPLREIATALGLSHQRVHQMVEEAIGKKGASLRRRVARTAKQGGLALLVVLLPVTGFFTLRPDLSPIAPASKDASSGNEGRISVAPVPSETPAGRGTDQHDGAEFHSVRCGKRTFAIRDRFLAGGPGAKARVVFQPACDVIVIERRRDALEGRVRRHLRRMTIEIRGRRA